MPRLAAPGEDVRASFVAAVRELEVVGEPVPAPSSVLSHPVGFHAFVAMLETEADPAATRPAGLVPQTTLWWVEDEEYLGRISLRHRLVPALEVVGGHIGYEVRPWARRRGHATAMLASTLPLVHTMGIDPALITCSVTNDASRRVIEANGGVPTRALEPQTLRFWVPTA